MADFGATIGQAYATEGAVIDLGRGVHEGALAPEAVVRLPLATMNRHGLIAGATGTGKTKTLQLITEQLSAQGVPVFVADVKGDVSGLAEPGEAGGPAEARMKDLGLPFAPAGFPVEFLSLGGIGPGVPVRATVSDFGPQLLAKVLGANETQESSLGLVFHYADTKGLPLLDLGDLRALLTYLDSKDGKAELEGIGGLSQATVGVLLRSLVGLETGGGTEFFGEPQFEIADLLRVGSDGRGVISCLELPAVQDKPGLFSTVMMWLVAELFEQLPEAGDLDKPKLVFFLDEAHLLFADATDAFAESVTRTVRLIRSKGVGVFFVTQAPTDLPESVLGQLGSRVQHALRAFTPKDAKDLKAVVSTYPTSDFYDVGELLTSMGTGEAAVTLLSEKGVPTPVVHTRMVAPASKMAPAGDVEGAAKASPLFAKYGTRVDAQSARELLAARLEAASTPVRARSRTSRSSTCPFRSCRSSAVLRRPSLAGSVTSSTRGRARRSSARSSGGSSGCFGSGCSGRRLRQLRLGGEVGVSGPFRRIWALSGDAIGARLAGWSELTASIAVQTCSTRLVRRGSGVRSTGWWLGGNCRGRVSPSTGASPSPRPSAHSGTFPDTPPRCPGRRARRGARPQARHARRPATPRHRQPQAPARHRSTHEVEARARSPPAAPTTRSPPADLQRHRRGLRGRPALAGAEARGRARRLRLPRPQTCLRDRPRARHRPRRRRLADRPRHRPPAHRPANPDRGAVRGAAQQPRVLTRPRLAVRNQIGVPTASVTWPSCTRRP